MLANATTIHKSQGSEYPAVVIPLTTQHYPMLQRNLVYTGVTRGRRLVVLVGRRKALAIAVKGDDRTAFGVRISDQSVTQERIAEARIMIEQARLLTLKAAWMMDKYGNKEARAEIAMIKVAAPNMACRVIDWAIQAFGGAGVTSDYGLAYAYATARVLRLADGPDEVHRNQIARLEMRKYQGPASLNGGSAEPLPADTSAEFRRRPVWIA